MISSLFKFLFLGLHLVVKGSNFTIARDLTLNLTASVIVEVTFLEVAWVKATASVLPIASATVIIIFSASSVASSDALVIRVIHFLKVFNLTIIFAKILVVASPSVVNIIAISTPTPLTVTSSSIIRSLSLRPFTQLTIAPAP
jgi:hypothetical protein